MIFNENYFVPSKLWLGAPWVFFEIVIEVFIGLQQHYMGKVFVSSAVIINE